METLLKVKDLKKYFPIQQSFLSRKHGNVYAVDGVSLELARGQTLGLVGESGCGKSTLGRTILRLYEPTSGSINFLGKEISTLSEKELRPLRRHMQIIFQDPFSSLNPRMTIEDILSEPFIIHEKLSKAQRQKKVAELLEVVGLNAKAASSYPHEFSGGQRQRIGIARAIALEPNLIIADEPVSALDVSIQAQILNLLVDLRKKYNLSYLFIAHDLAVVHHISDFVAVMYLGKIVEYADAEELYKNPKHPYTKALMKAIPQIDFNRKAEISEGALSGDIPSPSNPPKGCHFHPRCPYATDLCRQKAPILEKRKNTLVSCHYS